jgi:hypothetical protein
MDAGGGLMTPRFLARRIHAAMLRGGRAFPRAQTSPGDKKSGLAGTLALPVKHFWRVQLRWPCQRRASFHNNKQINQRK